MFHNTKASLSWTGANNDATKCKEMQTKRQLWHFKEALEIAPLSICVFIKLNKNLFFYIQM